MDGMRRRTALTLAIALLAGLLTVGAATPAQACSSRGVRTMLRSGNALEVISLRTYHLVVEADKPAYKVGDTAVVNVTVTRPAHEDPLGQGIPIDPPESFPAEDVNVGIGLRVGDVFLFGHALTNADGLAKVKIDIKSYTPAGKASADAYAWKTVQDTPCAKVEENGYTREPDLFRVFRRI